MANYLSTPDSFNKVQDPVNLGLINTVMAAKQGRFDTSVMQIDQGLAELGKIDSLLKRDKDRQHLANNVQSLLAQVNNSGKLALDNPGVTRNITNQIHSALDSQTINAVAQGQKIDAYNANVAKLREKDPNTYNDANYSFSLAQGGADQWLTGQTDTIGNLSYNPYVDVTATQLKKIKDLKDLRGKQVIETPDPQNPGRMIKRTIDGLTSQEIFEYIPNILTSQEDQQLKINGWAKYKDQLPLAQRNFEAYKTSITANIDENISNQRAFINNSAIPDSQKKEAQVKMDAYIRQKEQTNSELSSLDLNDPVTLGGFLEKENWKSGIANMAQAKWSQEINKDEYYFAKAGLEIQQSEEQRAQQKFGLDMTKSALEIAKLQQELGVDAQGNAVNASGAITTAAREGALENEIDPFKGLEKEYLSTTAEMVSLIGDTVNNDRVSPDIKEHYASEMNKMGYDAQGNVLSGKEKTAAQFPKSLAMKMAFDASNVGAVYGDVAKQLAGIEVKRNSLANEYWGVKGDALTNTFAKKPDTYIQSLRDEMKSANVDSSVANRTASILDTALDTVTLGTLGDVTVGDSARKDAQLYSKAKTFVDTNGGWDNLKKVLTTDKVKLSQFADILNGLTSRSARIPSANFVRQDLKNEATDVANTDLNRKTVAGQTTYFNTSNIATIGSEPLRKRIINMIPQTDDTQVFNEKAPLSFYKNEDETLTIVQNKGYTDGKESTKKVSAQVVVGKEDAAYKELIKYAQTSSNQQGLDAQRTSIKITPGRNINYLDNTKKTLLGKADTYINNISPEIRKGFVAPPNNFLTEQRTLDVYKAALKNKIPEAKLETLVNSMSENLNKFVPTVKPFDGTWAINLATSNGKTLTEGDTGMQYLQDDIPYLVKNYPQVLVSEGVLRYLIDNPTETEVDNLIKSLQ